MKKYEITTVISSLALAAFVWIYSAVAFSKVNTEQGLAPSIYPQVLATILAILALLELGIILYNAKKHPTPQDKVSQSKPASNGTAPGKKYNAFLVQGIFILVCLVYVYSLTFQSFFIPTTLFCFALMSLFSVKPARAMIVSLGYSIGFYLIFAVAFGIPIGRFI